MDKAQLVAEAGHPSPDTLAPAEFGAQMWQVAVVMFMMAATVVVLLNTSTYSVLGSEAYLPLHVGMEVFAVIVSVGVFSIGWHSFDRQTPLPLVVVSSAFLAVGLLDFAHLLSFPGMPAFLTPNDASKAIGFWLAARLAGAVALLLAAVLPWQAPQHGTARMASLAAAGCLTIVTCWVVLWRPELLPETFAEGLGPTTAKIVFEYALITIYLLAAALLLQRALDTRMEKLVHLFTAACVMALSEVCFTLYIDVTDTFNVLGHVYKVVAYLFLHRAIFVEGVREPILKLRASEQLIKRSENKFRKLMESAPDAILLIDGNHRIAMMNARAEQLFGYQRDMLVGMPSLAVIPEGDFLAWTNDGKPAAASFETDCRSHDGRFFPAEISIGHIEDEEQPLAIAVVRDMTDRQKATEEKSRLAAVLDAMPDFVIFTDAARHPLYLNRAARNIAGLAEGDPGDALQSARYMPPWAQQILREKAIPAALRDGYWQGETAICRPDGLEIPVSQVLLCHKDEAGTPAYWSMICRDVSERKHFESLLLDQVTHDGLTGLANRALLNERLRTAVAQAQEENGMLAVLFVGLDHFKRINDTFGHAAGNDVLRETARRLKRALGSSGMLARQGSDEFIVLQQTIGAEMEATILARRLMESIHEPFRIAGQEIFLSASIGISLFPADERNAERLLRNAAIALSCAKTKGRNCYCLHTPEMDHAIHERLALEGHLRHAVERNELVLHYQPRICIATGRQVGMEALVRWQHPDLGMISPMRFIPVAEETGLIEPIGLWVLRTACAQMKAWQEDGLAPMRVSVNISARQFQQAGLANSVRSILEDTGLDPSFLELEITETTIMKDTESAIRSLRALKQLGIGLSVDDFGTGYSSLSYLKLFPIDVLKVDRSFVKDVIENPDDAAITRAIVALAHSLELLVVAEGVETLEQAQFLKACGCDEIQGFYFSKPLPGEAMAAFLRQQDVMLIPDALPGAAPEVHHAAAGERNTRQELI